MYSRLYSICLQNTYCVIIYLDSGESVYVSSIG